MQMTLSGTTRSSDLIANQVNYKNRQEVQTCQLMGLAE